jgi:SpoVK/Ycf46/Vps4 family AAA+-type ATPase
VATGNSRRLDPYRNFKFRVTHGARTVAALVEAKATWKDIALRAALAGTLRRLANDAGRSRGARALFVGESGTARKAAEVIARHLDRNLFVIDLDAVVSKYVGDTEEQIGKLFDAADASGAVLFLDEAEALFGKRTGVNDSHDRFTNVAAETVLRRLQSFGGMAIVASRRKSGLDSGLLCALRPVVAF